MIVMGVNGDINDYWNIYVKIDGFFIVWFLKMCQFVIFWRDIFYFIVILVGVKFFFFLNYVYFLRSIGESYFQFSIGMYIECVIFKEDFGYLVGVEVNGY